MDALAPYRRLALHEGVAGYAVAMDFTGGVVRVLGRHRRRYDFGPIVPGLRVAREGTSTAVLSDGRRLAFDKRARLWTRAA